MHLNDLESLCFQRLGDQVHMGKISGFHFYTKEAAIHAFCIALFIMHAGHITAAIGNDSGNIFQLAGFIDQFDQQTGRTAGL